MTIKTTLSIDDAELEAGIAQGLAADNEATGQSRTLEEFVADSSVAALEGYRGSAKRALQAKLDALNEADVAEVAALVDAKMAAKGAPA